MIQSTRLINSTNDWKIKKLDLRLNITKWKITRRLRSESWHNMLSFFLSCYITYICSVIADWYGEHNNNTHRCHDVNLFYTVSSHLNSSLADTGST